MLLVLASTLSAMWWRQYQVLIGSAIAVLGFNYMYVEPVGHVEVKHAEDLVLLVTTLTVSATVAFLMDHLKRSRARADAAAKYAEQLRELSERIRRATAPADLAAILQQEISLLFQEPVMVRMEAADGILELGEPTRDEQAALAHCARSNRAMGVGTDHFPEFPATALPVRAPGGSVGSVLVRLSGALTNPDTLVHATAICNLVGTEFARIEAQNNADQERAEKQVQLMRSTLLSSIAHDHRTPLATILGAVTSLLEHQERLTPYQQVALARTIADETEHLIDLTENTLQLARLGAPGIQISADWEAADELIAAVVRRSRQRFPSTSIITSIAPNLPLVRCDAVLIVQLLDNLLNNAIKHAETDESIVVGAKRDGEALLLSVADRGAGIRPAMRGTMFDPFSRGSGRGMGLGLAVCKAIASVHHASLCMRDRDGGGTVFEFALPIAALDASSLPQEN